MKSLLFSPLKIRELEIRNRIVLSPMLQYSCQAGHVNDWHLTHLTKFAAGGVGLVFMESTKVDPRGCSTSNDPGLWRDDYIQPLARIVSNIKHHGAAAGIQLSHSGRKARRALPWEGRTPLQAAPIVGGDGDWELIGPSAIPHSPHSATPKAMSLDDIRYVIAAWGDAAERAHQAGFDLVEIHGGHGYLIHQFLSPLANQRTDEYGGSLVNRMRFAIEVAREVRRRWPESKPLFYRISAVDGAGWAIEDSIELARALKLEGVDVVDCSSGGMSEIADSEILSPLGYQVPYAEAVKTHADIQTMAVGMIVHAEQAEEILQGGKADLVALGRELLHNPHWALSAAQRLGEENPFSHVARQYAFWLEKRWKRGLTRTSA